MRFDNRARELVWQSALGLRSNCKDRIIGSKELGLAHQGVKDCMICQFFIFLVKCIVSCIYCSSLRNDRSVNPEDTLLACPDPLSRAAVRVSNPPTPIWVRRICVCLALRSHLDVSDFLLANMDALLDNTDVSIAPTGIRWTCSSPTHCSLTHRHGLHTYAKPPPHVGAGSTRAPAACG